MGTQVTTSQTPDVAPGQPAPAPIPPLENGDRLSRDEFERRYRAMPQLKKAELIEGVVHMPSPVRWQDHGSPQADFIGWMVFYRSATPGVQVGDNSTVRLDLDNEPQPDAALRIDSACGGQSRIDDEGYVVGSPELVGEIAASSVSLDLHAKLNVYRRNGVREYVVWRVLDREIDWFVLRQSRYEKLPLDPSGIYRSEIFPGLWLHANALVRGDMAAVFQVLQQGLASAEHAAFVGALQAHGGQ